MIQLSHEVCFYRAQDMLRPCTKYVSTVARGRFQPCLRCVSTVLEVAFDFLRVYLTTGQGMFLPSSRYFSTDFRYVLTMHEV